MSQRGSGSDAKSSAVLTRVRWVGAFVVLLLVCPAVPVFAAEQAEVLSSEKVEFTPPTSQEEEIAAAQVPGASAVSEGIEEAEREEAERDEWLASPVIPGDSGSPVWNKRTGASIGLVSAGRPEGSFEETLVAPLLHPPNMPANRVPGILHHQGMAPLHLKVGG